jgi:hypothetical protein
MSYSPPVRTIVANYEHVQDTPADVWTINHGAGGYPVVDVYVLVDDVLNKIIPNAVTYVSPTVCTVSFTTTYSGVAKVS